ncbi:hypothetical protein F5Y15DRAFT_422716 [Xylariaceae sp. FL0016]|nr:hypothetical protein F5Y15DRAFT_422716 [Xylariaceae sp. FL0016]
MPEAKAGGFWQTQSSYGSLADFVIPSSKAALRHASAEADITHKALHDFVKNFSLPVVNRSCLRKPIIAIILPNGPLLAATVIATATWYAAAPINPAAGAEQVAADIALAGASGIVTCRSECERLGLEDMGLDVFFVDQADDGSMLVENTDPSAIQPQASRTPNQRHDYGIILFTSGTSGNKKVVPMTVHSIVCGVGFVIDSWALTADDTCLNMMPLYHVGGLIRNIFAPIFAGGSTICCPAFDGNLFWDVVDTMSPTWYYASPSMHSVILDTAVHRSDALAKSQIRLICNAAGGLLPALAAQLRNTFQSIVLPSYGMTECMPISTPPIDYQLDRPGTSGISVGPELTVRDGNGNAAAPGVVGCINVRGEPTFKGYLRSDGSLDTSALTPEGWFDTGDMGYMDADGYLYITGRNKEVINRGGELISPFEVENAIVSAAEREDSPIFGRVTQALAFSARHEVLQEVVGVVLVTPQGQPRVDLRLLHEALRSSLQQAKWPVLVVLRIRLGERLSLDCTTDETPFAERHLEAQCPPTDTDLVTPIQSWLCDTDPGHVQQVFDSFATSGVEVLIQKNTKVGTLEALVAPALDQKTAVQDSILDSLKAEAAQALEGYLIPHKYTALRQPFPRNEKGLIDHESLQKQLEEERDMLAASLESSTEGQITQVFAELLQLDVKDIPADVSFIDLGGDSLRAGKLLSILRSKFNMHLPIDLVFSAGSVERLSDYINNELSRQTTDTSSKADAVDVGNGKMHSSTNPFLLVLQLLPLVVVYPVLRAIRWTIFVYTLNFTRDFPTNDTILGRLLNLVLSMYFSRIVKSLVSPWIGIALKWTIMGRHREGLYPMWGPYHTRWWMTQKLVDICGKGVFGLNDKLVIMYYRLLGAKIGSGVTLKHAQLGEWDLLEIGDNATLDGCTVRPMAGERNATMYLGKIRIGNNASVGVASIVAPGTHVPDDTCIGPNSSSHEMEDADETNRDLSATKGPKPHWALSLFATAPLAVVARFLYLLPWFLGLLGLAAQMPMTGNPTIADTLDWFAGSQRVGFHYLARSLRTLIGPFFIFGFVVLIRVIMDRCFGRLGPSAVKGRGNVETWRMALMKSLMPLDTLREMTEMFGQHYEMTSIAIRMLGGKAGKRIYWPGTGPSIGDYHLLDVGNDVVFGSRSHLITSDGTGSNVVKIGDGAMIADRVVLLPGAKVEKGAIMGSGALTRRDKTYGAGATYVGSKGGDSICLTRGRVTEKSASLSEVTLHDPETPATPRTPVSDSGAPAFKKSSSSPIVTEQSMTLPGTSSLNTLVPGSPNPFRTRTTKAHGGNNGALPPAPPSPLDDTASPFGRAFYLRMAPYYVLRPWQIFFVSSFVIVAVHLYWDATSISSIQVLATIAHKFEAQNNGAPPSFGVVFGLFAALISGLVTVQVCLAIGFLIASKWVLLGRRQPGNYDWDKSSYCQRWQLYLTMERLRQRCMGGNGILSFFTGTAYVVWYFRALGATIGRDCALFVNGKPSLLFTEPDLLTLGDRVVVDNASLVGHVNTRGKFDLNRLRVGDRSVLRSNSRLLSGAEMGADSCLLEHTLVMGGDIVGEGETMQGWPATRFTGSRVTGVAGQ